VEGIDSTSYDVGEVDLAIDYLLDVGSTIYGVNFHGVVGEKVATKVVFSSAPLEYEGEQFAGLFWVVGYSQRDAISYTVEVYAEPTVDLCETAITHEFMHLYQAAGENLRDPDHEGDIWAMERDLKDGMCTLTAGP
jgi:hypothetical protein